jgi:hypothetical protein
VKLIDFILRKKIGKSNKRKGAKENVIHSLTQISE